MVSVALQKAPVGQGSQARVAPVPDLMVPVGQVVLEAPARRPPVTVRAPEQVAPAADWWVGSVVAV